MNIYKINNDKFKSIYFSYNFTVVANKEDISYYNVLASIFGKCNNKFRNQKLLQEYLYSLYGANFDVNVEKIGDLFNIEFKIEFINFNFLPNKQDILDDCLNFIYSSAYDTLLYEKELASDLAQREKENVLEKILTRKDDKLKYAVNRTEEIMCKDDTFGTFIYGDENTVRNIKLDDLQKYYKKMIDEGIITVIVSGNLNGYDNIDEKIKNVFGQKANNINDYTLYKANNKINKDETGITEIKEKVETVQSVITLGFDINNMSKQDFFVMSVYNAILGGTPSSKLFQNFREKESLAYTVRSRYYRYKDMIIIYAGIEQKNYEKAKEVLKVQIDDMNKGNITLEEFEAAKESVISDLREVKDSKIGLAKMLISNLFYYNNDEITVDTMIEEIKKVTLEQVILISNKINLELIYLLGGEENEKI